MLPYINMSNKVKTLYESQDGIELKQWLDVQANRRLLDNKRILYVVRANIDNSLIKFGIGELSTEALLLLVGCCNTLTTMVKVESFTARASSCS